MARGTRGGRGTAGGESSAASSGPSPIPWYGRGRSSGGRPALTHASRVPGSLASSSSSLLCPLPIRISPVVPVALTPSTLVTCTATRADQSPDTARRAGLAERSVGRGKPARRAREGRRVSLTPPGVDENSEKTSPWLTGPGRSIPGTRLGLERIENVLESRRRGGPGGEREARRTVLLLSGLDGARRLRENKITVGLRISHHAPPWPRAHHGLEKTSGEPLVGTLLGPAVDAVLLDGVP